MTTRPQADLAVLKTIAATNRWSLGSFSRPTCLGVHAEVQHAGELQVDETLAFAATVDRVVADLPDA